MDEFARKLGTLFGFDPSFIGGSKLMLLIDVAIPLVLLLAHFNGKLRALPLHLVLMTLVLLSWYGIFLPILEIFGARVHLAESLGYSLVFGVCLYIALCEWLQRGAAVRLTGRRTEAWAKEIDYLYIALAAFGIVSAIAKSQFSLESARLPEALSSHMLIAALVLRLIKTRVEVGGWNKPGVAFEVQPDLMTK